MRDLIFVSMENWDTVWRRNQFVCAGLAKRYPDHKILFVGLARDVSNRLRAGKLAELRAAGTFTVTESANITVTRPLKFFPNSLAWGRCANDVLLRAQVQRQARRLRLRSPLLWLNPHYAVHMVGRMNESAVVYDITDDWSSLTQSLTQKECVVAQDAALCRRAGATIVCSERLYALKKDKAQRLFLIPNGVDAAHYRKVLDDKGPLPDIAVRWPKPVLGYTGTLHPDRVDVTLLAQLAERLTTGCIVLVGPDMLSADTWRRLQKRGNVFYGGTVPYAELPTVMRAFDVCITPHKVTPFTESLNPIKLWEYLAAGKPIVSTNVAGFRDYPQHVRIAEDADSFYRAVQEALREDPARGEARRQEAVKHSWEARLDAIEAVFQSV